MAETLFTDIINNLGKTKVKVTGSGSKSGKQQILGAPSGITSDKETINLQGSAEIPITNNVDFLLDGQYNKFRDNIEYKDDQIFLEDAPSNIDRKVGIGFNKDGEGFSGYGKYGIDSGEPELFVKYKKTFADGGSTNGSGEKAFTAKVKELMDDGYEFGEAVKEAMRQGYAKGGRINFDSGGSPLQQLRQALVDDLMYKFPSMKEEDMQMIVKDINLDMSTEEAQASMSANFTKVFGSSGMFSTGGRVGYKKGDKVTPISQINAPQRAYQSLINLGIEAKVKELFQSGFGAGNITKKLKLLYKGQPNIANKINSTLIGNYLTYAKRNLGLVKPGLAVAIQNQYGPMRSLTEVQKAIDEAPKIKKGNKYFDMNARDLEGRSVWNHTDSDKSRTGKKGKQYVSRTEIEAYKDKLKIKGSGKEVLIDNSKTKSNQERYKKDKLAKLNAGPETVALNKELSTKYVTKENNKLRQDFKNNPSETISKLRNNKNIMFQLETSFDSQSGEFKSEKVTNKKIKNLIKAGMFSIEHTSPMAKGAKNTNFTTNLSLITNRANTKIMRPLDTFMNSDKYKDFSDTRVVKVKDFLDKNNLRVKIRGMDGYFGGDNKLTARERLAKQSQGFRLNSAAAAVEDGVKGIYSNVKDAVSNITDVDYDKMQLGKGNVAKFAGIAKNAAKVAGKALGVAALPLEAYFMKQMYNEGKTPAEILASPFFLSNMVGEAQDLLKMEPVERQAIKNEQIAEDFSMMDSDFYTPPLKGVEAVNTQMVKDRVAQERALEEEKRKNLRNKTLPNEGLLRILSNPTYKGVL